MTDRIGVAVVGAGGWGKNHVRNFANLPGAELRWVCDASPGIRDAVNGEFPSVGVCDRLDQVLEDAAVQAIVLATPAPSHAELATRVLESGRDVLVEKPLALTSAEAAALCDLADAKARILMVGHLLLYHPAVLELKDRIDEGELGDVLYVYSHRLNLGVVRRDENAWWSLAPHDISVANFLLGEAPDAVSATGGCFLQTGRGIEDVVFATLHYPDGKLAHAHVSWLDPHKTRSLTVVGSKKMAVFDDTSPDEKLRIYDKGAEPPPSLSYDEGVRIRTGEIRVPALRMQEPLRRECAAFVESVRTRARPIADGRSGLAVVKALEAGHRSLGERGRLVEVAS